MASFNSYSFRTLRLFRFGDTYALILFSLAFSLSVGNGVITPLFSVIFGNLVDSFSKPGSSIQSDINEKVLTLLYLSIAAFFVGAGEMSFSAFSTKRQLIYGRLKVMDVIINRPLSWHQVNKSVEVIDETLNQDLPAVEIGLNGLIKGVRHIVCCVAGLAVAFSKGPILTILVLSIVLPTLAIFNFALKRLAKGYQMKLQKYTRQANSIVRETFSQIKTIASFNLEGIFNQKYQSLLPALQRESVITSFLSGAETAIMAGIFSFSYAVAIYYGAKKVADGEYSGGQVLSVLFASIMAGFSASEALPCLHCVWLAIESMDNIDSTILDSQDDPETEGSDDIDFNMDIQFHDVCFAYPTRPEKLILSNLNLSLRANSSSAIVGPSGSGKSTIMNLLLKHYIPNHGSILIDGIELSEVNDRFWRSNVAFIPQETAIFSGSILENIRLARPDASFDDILDASRRARCHHFVEKMPNGYSTHIGNHQLSGGQRQRIGIARAFLRDARLILLDEATSALDNKSEQEIQDALSAFFESGTKTVVTIAHKLSTVVRMDTIVVLKGGQTVEQGTHDELIASNGVYSSLVEAMQSSDLSYGGGEEIFDGLESKAKQKPVLRDSVLRKKSVRLSIIPERLRKALDKKQENNAQENKCSALDFSKLMMMIFGGSWFNKMQFFLALSILSSCAMGLQYPGFSLALAGSVEIYLRPTADSIRSGGSKWGIIYTCIGFGCIIAGTVQAYSRAMIGQKLERILKEIIYRKTIHFPIEWHDQVENDQSAMQAMLSNHCQNIQQSLSSKLSVIFQTIVTLIASITIAFTASTRLTLVILAVFPLLLAAQIVQTWLKSQGYESTNTQINRFALEATKNIKDVLSFSMQNSIKFGFRRILQLSDRHKHRMFIFTGLAYGCSQFLLYNTIGLAFWFGTKQVVAGQITVEDLMRAFCALFFATFSIAQSSNQLATIAKAAVSKEKILKVLSDQEANKQFGARLPICRGEIFFDNVTFSYPSRPDRLVFKHFSLKIPPKSSCALVGESGHGKSSCFGLLEAFYAPIEGTVKVDGVDINKFDKEWIRSIVSFVTQDPVIFEDSIFDNIKYGNPGADRASVIAAAKIACCHEFIETLPESYDTKLADDSIQLSGGQRQRIAIARAVLKKSSILLMDEPTAALDSHSERQVQKSLKTVMQDKTCIVVAHRLNTIKDFDMIAAIYRGRVLEKGTHQELLDMDGYYCYLIRTQGQ